MIFLSKYMYVKIAYATSNLYITYLNIMYNSYTVAYGDMDV